MAAPTKEPKIKPVKLRAVYNRMRNSVTGAVYKVHQTTDVANLEAPECAFERAQLEAGVLLLVEDWAEESNSEESNSEETK